MVQDHPAAWHPDPTGLHDHRWWDGTRWTEHVADAGVASVDPLPSAPLETHQDDAEPSPERTAGDAGPDHAGVDATTQDAGPAAEEPRPAPEEPEPTPEEPRPAPEEPRPAPEEPEPTADEREAADERSAADTWQPDRGADDTATAAAEDRSDLERPWQERTADATSWSDRDPEPDATSEHRAEPGPGSDTGAATAAPWDPVSPAAPVTEHAAEPLSVTPDPTTPIARTTGLSSEGSPGAPGWTAGDGGRTQEGPSRPYRPAGFAATSLVLAATAIPLSPLVPWYVPVGGIVGLVAVVLAVVALRRVKRGTGGGRGIAVGGLVTGMLAIALSLLFFWYYTEIRRSLDRCVADGGSEAGCQEDLVRQLTDRFLPGG